MSFAVISGLGLVCPAAKVPPEVAGLGLGPALVRSGFGRRNNCTVCRYN